MPKSKAAGGIKQYRVKPYSNKRKYTNPAPSIRPEKKYVDISGYTVREAPLTPLWGQKVGAYSINLIGGLAPGTGASQRDGRRVKWNSLYLRANILSPSDLAEERVCRLMVVLDKQANGTALTAADLFQDSDHPGVSQLKMSNRERFRVLYDNVLPVALPGSAPTVVPVQKFMKMGMQTTFSDDTAQIGSISTNALYFIHCATTSLAPSPDIYWSCRLRYYDA